MQSKSSKAYAFNAIRQKHPKAYERWTEDEDVLLVQKFREGTSTEELSKLFQRRQGAILSRLRKLNLAHLQAGHNISGANSLKVDFSFDWIPAFSAEDKPYFFPQPITDFMGRSYKHPAVYRWNIYKTFLSDERKIYIGECKQLCPERINGYLNPGPKQETNKRLNEQLIALVAQGLKVQLEIIRFDNISIGDFTLTLRDLSNKHLRRFIESLLITYYQRNGFTLLNR